MREKLETLKLHAYYKNYFKKLMAEDVAYMNNFLSELEVMNLEQRNLAVYRSAMRENKPKNWKIVEELLSIVIK
jgi:hypothetical protein